MDRDGGCIGGDSGGGIERKGANFSSRSGFTEAVPLSLSSVAHASIPLEDGVLDGIRQIVQHTLFSCVIYARVAHPPHEWTFRDLTTTPFAWEPVKGEVNPSDTPFTLQRMEFKHQYARNALVYLKSALPKDDEKLTAKFEQEEIVPNWSDHKGVLGLIRLLYITTEPLTKGEMDGSDVEDIPPLILYKIVAEYRTIPPTGNKQAVQAEELSMLSFGGSVDDSIKFGALASLYDVDAKYVLEIYSTRGKKYKFDLMDATLSNGMIPQLPTSREGDPFVKSLCVTVTDHDLSINTKNTSSRKETTTIPNSDGGSASAKKTNYAVTRMQLLLEGKPRKGKDFTDLPEFNYFTDCIKEAYLNLNPEPQAIITALPSGNSLLLDPKHAGRIYVNGSYVTTWGKDPRIGCHGTALFGMDLHSIPMWHNRIVDYEAVKISYGQMWQEILIDARLQHLNLATKLLYRLMKGREPEEEEEVGKYDVNDADATPDVNSDCLESEVMSSETYDPVGISPKALATRFSIEFGASAFPCLPCEEEWVKSTLPDRIPVLVPQRVISILRRGGYFDTQRTAEDLWFLDTRKPAPGAEKELVLSALLMLEESGCDDVSFQQIAFCSAPLVTDVIRQKVICRYSEAFQQYSIHEKFLDVSIGQFVNEFTVSPSPSNDSAVDADERVKAYMLGFYIAREHPDGRVLARYLLRKADTLMNHNMWTSFEV